MSHLLSQRSSGQGVQLVIYWPGYDLSCISWNLHLNMGKANRLICVLGMHRSGTSCVTGSLQQAGLFLGDCHTWNPHNKKGNRENQDFVDLNDEVLAANNGAWDKPPKKVKWALQHIERAKALLQSNASDRPLGFKDPRTLLVLEGWKQVFPNIQFVGVVRHPNAVAQSLKNRSDMPIEQALLLWYAYNRILYKEYKKNPFPILCFDDDEPVFHEKLDGVAQSLGLTGGSEESRFYDEQLRTSHTNQQQMLQALPWKIKRLHNRLLRRCI